MKHWFVKNEIPLEVKAGAATERVITKIWYECNKKHVATCINDSKDKVYHEVTEVTE